VWPPVGSGTRLAPRVGRAPLPPLYGHQGGSHVSVHEPTGNYRMVIDFAAKDLLTAERIAADVERELTEGRKVAHRSALFQEESGYTLWAEPPMTHGQLDSRGKDT